MRNFRTAAAALAATGIAALGAVTATSGVANAATNLSITGCSTNYGLVTAGIIPTCSAPTGTIYNPTQITVSVDKSFLTAVPQRSRHRRQGEVRPGVRRLTAAP